MLYVYIVEIKFLLNSSIIYLLLRILNLFDKKNPNSAIDHMMQLYCCQLDGLFKVLEEPS